MPKVPFEEAPASVELARSLFQALDISGAGAVEANSFRGVLTALAQSSEAKSNCDLQGWDAPTGMINKSQWLVHMSSMFDIVGPRAFDAALQRQLQHMPMSKATAGKTTQHVSSSTPMTVNTVINPKQQSSTESYAAMSSSPGAQPLNYDDHYDESPTWANDTFHVVHDEDHLDSIGDGISEAAQSIRRLSKSISKGFDGEDMPHHVEVSMAQRVH